MSTSCGLTAGSRVRIGVPVHVENREASPGLKKGGAVNLVLHTVEVLAPADAIPESITIDLAGLDFHDSVHVSALKLPEGCRPVCAKTDLTVVTIVPPTVMVEERRPPRPGRRRRRAGGRLRAAAGARPRPLRPRPRPPPRPSSRGQEVNGKRPLPARPGEGAVARRAIDRGPMLVIAGLGNPGARHAAQPP